MIHTVTGPPPPPTHPPGPGLMTRGNTEATRLLGGTVSFCATAPLLVSARSLFVRVSSSFRAETRPVCWGFVFFSASRAGGLDGKISRMGARFGDRVGDGRTDARTGPGPNAGPRSAEQRRGPAALRMCGTRWLDPGFHQHMTHTFHPTADDFGFVKDETERVGGRLRVRARLYSPRSRPCPLFCRGGAVHLLSSTWGCWGGWEELQ